MGIGQLIVHSIRLIYNRAGLLNLLSPAGAELEGGVVGISRGLGDGSPPMGSRAKPRQGVWAGGRSPQKLEHF